MSSSKANSCFEKNEFARIENTRSAAADDGCTRRTSLNDLYHVVNWSPCDFHQLIGSINRRVNIFTCCNHIRQFNDVIPKK